LRQARDELETRVQARTVELAHANATLQAEIAERKQAEQAREQSLAQIEVARQRAEDLASELQLANSMLRALIEAMPAGVVVTDSDGGIILANPIAKAILSSALMGATLTERGPLYRLDGTPVTFGGYTVIPGHSPRRSVESIEAALHQEDNRRTFVLMAPAGA
jgi:PAS domain-containing protein